MSLTLAKLIGLFDCTRHVGSAVRAAAEFERARELHNPSTDDADRIAKGVLL